MLVTLPGGIVHLCVTLLKRTKKTHTTGFYRKKKHTPNNILWVCIHVENEMGSPCPALSTGVQNISGLPFFSYLFLTLSEDSIKPKEYIRQIATVKPFVLATGFISHREWNKSCKVHYPKEQFKVVACNVWAPQVQAAAVLFLLHSNFLVQKIQELGLQISVSPDIPDFQIQLFAYTSYCPLQLQSVQILPLTTGLLCSWLSQGRYFCTDKTWMCKICYCALEPGASNPFLTCGIKAFHWFAWLVFWIHYTQLESVLLSAIIPPTSSTVPLWTDHVAQIRGK